MSITSKVITYLVFKVNYTIMSTNDQFRSKPNVPFSWEKKPGVCKVIKPTKTPPKVLPQPPCPLPEKLKIAPFHNLQIPLPPCAFLAPSLLMRST